MIGKYKNYDYWIDENYKVHLGKIIKKEIKVSVSSSYIGTTSFTVNVNNESKETNIVGYKYKINNKETAQIIKESYTAENLEPNTEYKVSVIAIDKDGDSNSSEEIIIRTKERTYIVKDGVELVKINTRNASKNKVNNYLEITYTSTKDRGSWYVPYDVTKYKKVKYVMGLASKSSGVSLHCALGTLGGELKHANVTVYRDSGIFPKGITSSVPKESEINIENYTSTYEIGVLKGAESVATKAVLQLYNVWLEE